jgi:hypothetical protein
MDHDSDLLRPSLTEDSSPAAAIYSVRTGFLTAFFGGPLGGAIIALLNSYRLKRLAVDWPIGLLALAICAGMGWSATHGGWRWLDASLGHGSVIYVTRLTNLAFFGVVYVLHRTYYRSMSVLGLSAPNGLAVGVGAIVFGLAVNAALLKLMSQ